MAVNFQRSLPNLDTIMKNRSYCFYTNQLCLKMILCPFIVHWEKRGHKSPCVLLEISFFWVCQSHLLLLVQHAYTQGLIWERLEKTTPRFITIQSLSDLSTAGVLPEEQKTWRERTLPNLKVTIYIIESTLLRIVSFDPQNSSSGNPARYMIFSQAPWESSNSFLLLFLKKLCFQFKKNPKGCNKYPHPTLSCLHITELHPTPQAHCISDSIPAL